MNDLEQPIGEAYRGATTHHPDHPKAYVSSFKNIKGEVNFKSSDKHGHVKFWNQHGRNSAIKHAGIDPTDERLLESIEQLDELSKVKLSKYFDRATNDRTRHLGGTGTRKYFNRMDGTSLALRKIHPDTALKAPKVKASGKHPLEEEDLQEGIKKVGTYFTKKGGDTATLHQADHDPNHHMVVVNGKVTRHIQGSAEEAHKQLTADGFQGSLHEMYHGGTAGYDQVNKGDNIHHGVLMVHGVEGNRKVKKIHWADTATFNGQVATPANASKNDQVRKAKREGWRLHHHVASASHDVVKQSLDNHHKRVIANDRMTREGIKRRAALKEMVAVEIDRDEYDVLKEAHSTPLIETFYHGALMPLEEGSTEVVTYSHDLQNLPAISHDRSSGKCTMYISEISKDLLARYADRVSKMSGKEMMKNQGMAKLCSRLSELGHARRKLDESIDLSEMSPEELLELLADEMDYLDFKTKMRHRQVYEDRESGNWFVEHNGTRVSGPHPSEEQAVIYRDLYITSNDAPLSEMSIERTDVVNEKLKPSMGASAYIDDFVHSDDPRFEGKSKKERIKMALGAYNAALHESEQIDELSVHLLRHYSKEALTQLRARKGEKGWKKKELKRDKMVDLACHKAVGQDVKVPGRCDEDLLEASLATLSQLRYKKNNADEEEEIKAELEADGKVGAIDSKAEEENEHMKGAVSEGIGAKLYYAHVSKDGKPHGRVEIKALDHKNAIWQSTHIPVVLKGTKVDKVTTHDGQTVSEEVEDLEEGRRGRPRKDAKPVEGDEPNIIMSLRKAAYSTVGHKVQFKDGSHTIVHSRHAEKILNHFNGLKPHEKVQFQNHLMKGAEHVQNWHAFHPEDHKRDIPVEKKLNHRTIKKASHIPDRRETIRRIAAKLQAQKAK